MQTTERRLWFDAEKRVKRTLPRGRRIAFRIKLDAKFPTKSLVRAIFFLGFTFNNAPKKHFARDLGISTHKRLKFRRSQHGFTKRPHNATRRPEGPGWESSTGTY
jgi:hypothetical protein